MKQTDQTKKQARWKKFLSIVLMHIAIANVAVMIFSWNYIHSLFDYIASFTLSICISISIWAGSIFWRRIMDRIMPMDRFFIYRFIAETALQATHSVVSVYLMSVLFFQLLWDAEFTLANNYHMLVTALICFSVVYFFINSIIYMLRWKKSHIQTEELKKRQLELEYESLKSQMNPHFLFNSLNSLLSIIPEDSELAMAFTQKLSNIYRYLLQSKHADTVPLADELAFANNYIELQNIRFGSSIRLQTNISHTDIYFVVPLSIQTLLENAIKHNICSHNKPLHMDMEIHENTITVKNTFQPKQQDTKGNGIGLANIKEIYTKQFGKIVVVEQSEKAFSVTIPLLTKIEADV